MILAAPLSGEAGPLGLVLVILIGIATVLLIRNMDKRIKRLPAQFEQQPEPGRRPAGAPGDLPADGADQQVPRPPGQREP